MARRTMWIVGIAAFAAVLGAVPIGAAVPDADPRWHAARVDGGRVGVVIELADEPTTVTYAAAKAVPGLAALSTNVEARALAAARRQLDRVEAAQQALLPHITGSAIGAEVIYRLQRVYNGIVAYVDAGKVAALRALPGVREVHPLVPDRLQLTTSVPYIGAPQVWQGVAGNLTGAGVKIGIIDSGIDYLHKDFGGNGVYAGQNFADNVVPWNAKVVGGTDLAGDSYTGSNTPKPDGDPMDLESVSHGTHVAGIAAGYGVDAEGTTYGGPYTSTEDVSTFQVGPGVAPGAKLYAIRVFGSGLSTGIAPQGIEWAVDPNDDGDLSDHLDIINLSLGSPFGSALSATSVAAHNAAAAGVIVVAAGGNEGDTTYISGSPGVSGKVISAAASVDSGIRAGDLEVTSPAEIAGAIQATAALFGSGTGEDGLLAPLATTTPATACTAITNGGDIAGKIVLIDRGDCTFVTKVKAAQTAGAIGVVVANNTSGLINMAGSDPTITIPAVFISQADGTTLKGKLPSPGVEVRLSALMFGGTVAEFSARGPRVAGDALKPDLAAPGYLIFSAGARLGTGAVGFNGTSMATPHVAGAMALLKQLHPTWPPQALKALAMNTGTDLYANLNHQGPVQGPARVGGGQVNLPAAAAATAIAFDDAASDFVSLFFGILEVADATTLTRTVRVENHDAGEQTFTLGYTPTTDLSGVGISFPGGPAVTVPAGGNATFTVQLDAAAAAMNHDVDPAADTTQAGKPRYLPAEEAGYVTLTPATGTAIRVPLYAAARPVASLGAFETDLILGSEQGTATVNLTGQGLDTGGTTAADIVSLVTPLELQYVGPETAPSTRRNAAIRYVGVGSDYAAEAGGSVAATTLEFGIATVGDWTTPNEVEFVVRLDTNRDGTYDYSLSTTDAYLFTDPDSTPSDAFGVKLCQGASGCTWVGYPNRLSPAQSDTVVFATNVVVLAVPAASLGLADGATAFDYLVESSNATAGDVSTTSKMTYDVALPGLAPLVTGPTPAAGGQQLAIAYDRARYTADNAKGLLLLHHHNATGNRAEVVPVSLTDCTLTCSATVGAHATANAAATFAATAGATGCSPTIGYDWDFGDGTAHGAGESTEHTFANPGTYDWKLTVSGSGLTCVESGTIAVDPEATIRTPRRRNLQSVK